QGNDHPRSESAAEHAVQLGTPPVALEQLSQGQEIPALGFLQIAQGEELGPGLQHARGPIGPGRILHPILEGIRPLSRSVQVVVVHRLRRAHWPSLLRRLTWQRPKSVAAISASYR